MGKKLVLSVLIIFSLALFSGCNTIRGIGQDIESAGEAIKKAPDKK